MSEKTFGKVIFPEKIENIEISNKELMQKFFKYIKTRSNEKKIKNLKDCLNIFFCWNLENNDNKPFEKVEKSEMQDFFTFCLEELGFNPNKYVQMYSSLSSLSTYIENQLNDLEKYANFKSVVRKIERLPKETVRKKTMLSIEKIENLILSLEKQGRIQEALYLVLTMSCGAKLTENFKVTLDLIDESSTDFDGLFLVTKEPLTIKNKGQNEKQLYRYIIKDLFLPWYNKWLPIRKEIMKKKGVKEHNELFITRTGTPISSNVIYSWMRKWEEEIDEDIYPHSFRHYFVIYLSKIGLEKDFIKSILDLNNIDIDSINNDLRIDERKCRSSDNIKGTLKRIRVVDRAEEEKKKRHKLKEKRKKEKMNT